MGSNVVLTTKAPPPDQDDEVAANAVQHKPNEDQDSQPEAITFDAQKDIAQEDKLDDKPEVVPDESEESDRPKVESEKPVQDEAYAAFDAEQQEALGAMQDNDEFVAELMQEDSEKPKALQVTGGDARG